MTRHLLTRLFAATVPVALGVMLMLPAGASAATRTFTFRNFTSSSIKLYSIVGLVGGAPEFEGAPAIGSTLKPGESAGFELKVVFPVKKTVQITYLQSNGVVLSARITTTGTGATSSQCGGEVERQGRCATVDREIVFTDPPGSVVDIPAAQRQRQAEVLKRLCDESDPPGACSFKVKDEVKVYAPEHLVDNFAPVINHSDTTTSRARITVSDAVGTSDSVSVGFKIGGSIAKLVSVEINGSYGHTWTQTHTFSQTVEVQCAPLRACWIAVETPAYRDTGGFTVKLGHTTYRLPDVSFDSPDPIGVAYYHTRDCKLAEADCPPFGTDASLDRAFGVSRDVRNRPPVDSPVARPTFRVHVAGPLVVTPGEEVTYRVNVRSTVPRDRDTYAPAGIDLRARAAGRLARHWRLRSLAPGQLRTRTVTVAVPTSAHGRFCVSARASAEHARSGSARDCVTVARPDGT